MHSNAVKILEVILNNGLLISEISHGIVALPFAYFLWIKTKSIKKAIAVVILTYLVDFDHLLEYFLYFGSDFDLIEFLKVEYFRNFGKIHVPLHSWEIAFVLGYLSWKYKFKGWVSVFFVALLAHLIWDTYSNGLPPLFYFTTYRVLTGFSVPQ